MTIVIKITGHYLDDDEALRQFAQFVATSAEPIVIVHGGGKEITSLQAKLGIEPQYVDGLRVTDADSLALVEMVLCGTVNKRLVRYLLNAGVDAQGLSGVDRGLVRAEKMQHDDVDMGFTGTIISVRGEIIRQMLADGITPVIAPVSVGIDSNFNVNADPVTGALAGAIGAEKVIFISNVEGVLINNMRVDTLVSAQVMSYIEDGTIYGGMIPKVQTALDTLTAGIPKVAITNLDGLLTHGGTAFVQS